FTEELKLMTNPEVSIRPKGVMEKCSFCIQRIRKAKDRAKDEGRDVKDGEVIPACMQTCPTKAIIFGNLKDQNSEVYKKSKEKSFRILEELGVEPSVYYIKNNERKI
ncbi:MAG: 4Fe-4S ferredoxin, partial [candidate division WOR-3 bacterium]